MKWVITAISATLTARLLSVLVDTDVPAGLFMVYSYSPFTRRVRYVMERGSPRPCGWYYHLYPAGCVQQSEPGSTLLHSFSLTLPLTAAGIFFVLSESCSAMDGNPTSVPLYIITPLMDCPECNISVTWGTALEPPPGPSPTIITEVSVI